MGSSVEKYVTSYVPKLVKGGIIRLDHSEKGVSEAVHRTDMTKKNGGRRRPVFSTQIISRS